MKLRSLFCALPLFAALSGAAAFALKESDISEVYKLLERKSLYQTGEFQGEKGLTLRYLKFGERKGEKGSIVFVNGRGENLFKYIELFYDLSLQGWSPIYTYDHRGQGFSGIALPDSEIKAGYVEDYSHYRKDLEAFARLVSADPNFRRDKGFLIAHSMGGAIAADYLQNNPNQKLFQAAAMSSPMFQILSHQPLFVEHILLMAIKLYCWAGGCLKPVFDVDPKRSRREQKTNSLSRYKFIVHLEEKFPETRPSRPSFHWVLESFKAADQLLEEQRLKQIRAPILILQAAEEYLISNPRQEQFCQKISACCEIQKIPGRHEHFMEKDEYRGMALRKTLKFFSEYKTRRRSCKGAAAAQILKNSF